MNCKEFTFKINWEKFSWKGIWNHFKYGFYGSIHLTVLATFMYGFLFGFNKISVYFVAWNYFILFILTLIAQTPGYIITIYKEDELSNELLLFAIIAFLLGAILYLIYG